MQSISLGEHHHGLSWSYPRESTSLGSWSHRVLNWVVRRNWRACLVLLWRCRHRRVQQIVVRIHGSHFIQGLQMLFFAVVWVVICIDLSFLLFVELLHEVTTELVAKEPGVVEFHSVCLDGVIIIDVAVLILVELVDVYILVVVVALLLELLLDLLLHVLLVLVLLKSRVSVEVIVVAYLVTHRVHHYVYSNYFVEFAYSQLAKCLHCFEIYVAC